MSFSMFSESFPPASKFTVDDIPNLSSKVVIVTGANSGVGKETAKAILAHDAKVYIAARDEPKSESAIQDLFAETGKKAIFLKLDLADFQSIRAAADEFLGKEKELHILFNNGGIMYPPMDDLTADGYDLQFGTNVLGHFFFTTLLIPALLAGARSSSDKTARIVTTSSSAHHPLDFNTFRDGPARTQLGTRLLYAQSKAGDIVFANELARRYGDQGIVSVSVNPGNIRTDLYRHSQSWSEHAWQALTLYPVEYGALTQLWAGTSEDGAEFNGKYLIPWARVGTAEKELEDPELGQRLWEWMEEQVKDF